MYFTTSILSLIPLVVNAAPLDLKSRDNVCKFPDESGMVAITPGSSNAGWAMSPDQVCSAGSYCPYACSPGQIIDQWDPSATSYSYPKSQNGGLYCNDDGSLSKPFSDRPYCVNGTGKVTVDNQSDQEVAFCQTVLPGNEAMLIPNSIGAGDKEIISVPGPDFWSNTSSHFYVNPPGISTSDGCAWGSSNNPYGNWSPYVVGTNTDNNGDTYVKIGWNPIYTKSFANQLPKFGIRVTCDNNSNCDGLPCEIDPSKSGFNGVSGSSSGNQMDAGFCIVTALDFSFATIEVFNV